MKDATIAEELRTVFADSWNKICAKSGHHIGDWDGGSQAHTASDCNAIAAPSPLTAPSMSRAAMPVIDGREQISRPAYVLVYTKEVGGIEMTLDLAQPQVIVLVDQYLHWSLVVGLYPR